MIPTKKVSDVTHNLGTVRRFTIQDSDKAYQLLSDPYSNKPRAIVRELFANAWDAHESIGTTDVPIRITLPTELEPSFTIRDFGPGMSPETVMELYSSYFASTKESENKSIGGLGIGCKSPFCMTDVFTVVSIHNGSESTYTCFKDETGRPAISMLEGGVPTDEPNGVTIKLNIPLEHIYDVNRCVSSVCSLFPTWPVITNKDDFRFTELSVAFESKHCKVVNNLSNVYTNNAAGVMMGNILYPIDINAIRAELDNRELTHLESVLNVRGIFLIADIGSLDVSISRESLSYCPSTISNLIDVMQSAYDDILSELKRQCNERVAGFDRYRFIQNRRSDLLKKVPDSMGIDEFEVIDGITVGKFHVETNKAIFDAFTNNEKIELRCLRPNQTTHDICSRTYHMSKHISRISQVTTFDLVNVRFILNNTKQNQVQRMRQLAAEQQYTKSTVWIIVSPTVTGTIDDCKDWLTNCMHNVEYASTSTVEVEIKPKSTDSIALKCVQYGMEYPVDNISVYDDCLFINVSDGHVTGTDVNPQIEHVIALLKNSQIWDHNKRVVLVPPSKMKVVEKRTQWRSAYPELVYSCTQVIKQNIPFYIVEKHRHEQVWLYHLSKMLEARNVKVPSFMLTVRDIIDRNLNGLDDFDFDDYLVRPRWNNVPITINRRWDLYAAKWVIGDTAFASIVPEIKIIEDALKQIDQMFPMVKYVDKTNGHEMDNEILEYIINELK